MENPVSVFFQSIDRHIYMSAGPLQYSLGINCIYIFIRYFHYYHYHYYHYVFAVYETAEEVWQLSGGHLYKIRLFSGALRNKYTMPWERILS